MVRPEALPFEQDAEAPVSEPATGCRQGAQAFPHDSIIARLFLILERRSIQFGQLAGPTLAQLVRLHEVLHGPTLHIGRQKFFDARSFRAA